MRLACHSKQPRRSSESWVLRSHLVVRPLRGLQTSGILSESTDKIPSWLLAPLQSVTRKPCCVRRRNHFLEVFFPHSATVPSRATIPGLTSPGSRDVLALSIGPDVFLPRRSPEYVSIRRAHGVHPSELALPRTAVVSRPGIPSCDLMSTEVVIFA